MNTASNNETKNEKIVYTSDRRDLLFAFLILVCTFLMVIAVFWGRFNLGFSIAFPIALITDSIYLHKKGQKIGLFPALCGCLALCFSPVFVLTSNIIVRILCAVAAVLLSGVWFSALVGKKVPQGDIGLFRIWGTILKNTFLDLSAQMRALFCVKSEKRKKMYHALAGLLCALPIAAIVIRLLIRSDAAFEGLVSGLFQNIGIRIAQGVIALCLAPFTVSCIFSLRKNERKSERKREAKSPSNIFWIICLGVLLVVYVFYLFSQTAYFFSAFSGILPDGYTFSYAEYARRGFFELCRVAAINLVLLIVMLLFSRKENRKLPLILRLMGTSIAVFTLLIIGTSFSKLWIYILNYTMTVLRLGTGAFLLFMTVVFIAAIARCYTDKVKIFQTALIAGSVLLLVLGLGNINRMVAAYNYNDYIQMNHTTIDVEYLASFPEGIPYVEKLMDDEDLGQRAKEAFYCASGLVYKTEEFGTKLLFDANGKLIPKNQCIPTSAFNLPYNRALTSFKHFLAAHPNESQNMATKNTAY